jgi:type II secretion system protein J
MKNKNSFTLIEVMVAISIFAAVSVVLYACLRIGILSYKRIEEEARFQQKLRYAFSIIAKDIKNMIYMTNIPFEGDKEKVIFVSALNLEDAGGMNTARVSYYLKDGSQSKALYRKTEPLAHALRLLSEQGMESEDIFLNDIEVNEQIILDDIAELSFFYLLPKPDQFFKKFKDKTDKIIFEWIDLWESKRRVPIGMRIDVSLKHPANNEIVEFSRRAWIPTGNSSDAA